MVPVGSGCLNSTNFSAKPGMQSVQCDQLFRFQQNLNATLTELGGQLKNNMYFSVAQGATGSDPVYAMVQCRNCMSKKDCISCFTAASSLIRNCSSANGARVIFDGCFFRYKFNVSSYICSHIQLSINVLAAIYATIFNHLR